MGSYHFRGGQGKDKSSRGGQEDKSVSWLLSLGHEADGRFDSRAFSRTVTLE